MNPFLATLKPKELYGYWHGIIDIETHKFLVKYSRPGFGFLSKNTKVNILEYAKALTFIWVAPIWKDEAACWEV